jgi:predicted dehydrogenase
MSPRAEPLTFGLVGCGRIAQTHLEAIVATPGCSLAGVADVRAEAATSVAAQYECAGFTDHRRLLDGEGLDAVVVCTPPSSHLEIAGFFLDHGVHVLCEKPLAVTVEQGRMLVDKAESAGRLLMMASKFRYVDDVIRAKGIVDSGILGNVVLFENVFCSKVDMRDRWNAVPEIGGGGVLVDNGTHSVDIARFLLGPIVKVQAEEGRRVQDLPVEDTCRMVLRTAAGAMGVVDLSWSLHKERDTYIEVFGPEGVLSIGWKGSKYRQSEKLQWVRFGKGYDKAGAFSRQLRNFCAAIRGHEAPLITAEDALESVRVIEAAYRSLEMDKWVEVTGERDAEPARG